jgi:hypothetical protein
MGRLDAIIERCVAEFGARRALRAHPAFATSGQRVPAGR